MSLEKTEAILTKERGNQWDEQVIDAYFIARDQIREIAVHWNNDYFLQFDAKVNLAETPVNHANETRVRRAVESRRRTTPGEV